MMRILAGESASTDVLIATGDGAIIGHAMAADSAGPSGIRLTEIGVVVADAHRGRGVGSALVRQLVARAQTRGTAAVVMEVLAENRQVLTMIADHWPAAGQERSGACITIRAPLPAGPRRQEPRPVETGEHPPPTGNQTGTVAAGTAAPAR
jgi:GNAT superfamily N-acetyltransferase